MDKYIGRLLDNRYEILEVIGTGGMAVVYKARCHRLNRLVAIKILKDDFLEDEDFRSRFHDESQAVAMLSHPNIVSVYDVSTSISMEADYIVMELIEGITLKQYMEKKGVLNWKETLHFAMQIAKALEHAHSRGVVHRDIKPHNVMVLKNGSVKVADFGIARMMSKGETLTKEALGSVHYISPEQAKGGRVDTRSDIYSLGIVMYEMMSGRPPYEGDSPVAVAIQHINGGAILPSTLNPNIPAGMEQIIMKAMAKDLSDRYATATEMLTDMDEFRKDPILLFDYNTSPLEEVTKLTKPPIQFPGNDKPASDRIEDRSQARRQKRQAEKQSAAAAAAAAARRKKQNMENRGSRIATAAIIALSLVALLAIAVFLLMLFNGGFGNSKVETVEVPNLVGKYYDALQTDPNFEIRVQSEVYDQEYEAGQIISQIPVFGSPPVVKGTVIHITVSKGVEPAPIKMQNLIGLTQEQAEDILNSQSLNLQIQIEPEYNSTVAAGKVINTNPAADTVLTAGQAVTLVVSQGEAPAEEKKMPNLVGQTLDMAIKILKAYGFPEPEFESVYSYEDVGTVVNQSVAKETKIPLDTVIKLEVSKGPEETVPPTTEAPTTQPPTDPPVTTVTKDVTIDLSGKVTEEGTQVEIRRDGEVVYNETIGPDDAVVILYDQTGSGQVSYQISINGVQSHTEKVTFTTNG